MSMLALFFEVTPKPGHEDHYFATAAALKPRVEKNDGLLFLDRYRSQTRPETILSYQHWRDEASLAAWRGDAKHRAAQSAGRNVHFADYRLRIAEIAGGFSKSGGETVALPEHYAVMSNEEASRIVLAVESAGEAFPRGEPFASVNREDAFVSVLHVANAEEGREILRDAETQAHVTGAYLCRVSRDYGMFDRAEAPRDAPAAKTPV